MDVRVGLLRKLNSKELMVLNYGVGEDSWESLGLQGDPTSQSILKEISPGCSLEGLMLKLKLQYFGHLVQRTDSFEKTDAGKDWGQEEKGMTEDDVVGWHHWLNGHKFGWTPGVGDGQGGLACCGSGVCKESDMTERLNWIELNWETPIVLKCTTCWFDVCICCEMITTLKVVNTIITWCGYVSDLGDNAPDSLS